MTRFGAIAVVLLSACAHGNGGADVDASTGGTEAGGLDAPTCGGELPCSAIYVSKNGSDTAAGTADAPLKTLSAAITKASATTPPLAIFVGGGTFSGSVVMKAGLAIYGGFDPTWKRVAGVTTELDGPTPTVTFTGITVPTPPPPVRARSRSR